AERFQALSGRFGPEPVLRALADRTTRLAAAGRLLESYSYVDVLRRGYALVLDPATGHAIGSAQEATPGRAVATRFQDGERRSAPAADTVGCRRGSRCGCADARCARSRAAPCPATTGRPRTWRTARA